MLDSTGYPIKATDAKLPKNGREAQLSKYGDQWYADLLEAMNALREIKELEEIPLGDKPSDAKAIRTMWV